MTIKEYLYKQFEKNMAVSLEEIYHHCGVSDNNSQEGLRVRSVIKSELRLTAGDICPSHFKVAERLILFAVI